MDTHYNILGVYIHKKAVFAFVGIILLTTHATAFVFGMTAGFDRGVDKTMDHVKKVVSTYSIAGAGADSGVIK